MFGCFPYLSRYCSRHSILPLDLLSYNMYWSIMVFVSSRRKRIRKKGVEKTNSVGISIRFGEKWQQNLLSIIRSKMRRICALNMSNPVHTYNFFPWNRIGFSFAHHIFGESVSVCLAVLCFCVHQFDLMLYLVIGKPIKSEITFRICTLASHNFRLMFHRHCCCCCCGCYFILDMPKLHFNVFSEHIYLYIRLSPIVNVPSAFNSPLTKAFTSELPCVNANSIRFPQAEWNPYLFIYFDWCWWFWVEFVVSCQRTVANDTGTKDANVSERESVSLFNRISMDKEE